MIREAHNNWTWECEYYAQRAVASLENARLVESREAKMKYLADARQWRIGAMNFAKKQRGKN